MRPTKTLLKRLAESMGYELARKPSSLAIDSRFGLDVFGLLIDRIVERRDPKGLFLVQIGANDGTVEDVVQPVLRLHRIPSLLCEPLPDAFAKLRQAYCDLDHVALSQCAVGGESGTVPIFRIEPDATAQQSTLIASFDRDHVEHFCRVWDLPLSKVTTEAVICHNVNDFLKLGNRSSADIVAIDTEGMDHVICNQFLDLRSPPTIIHFEYANSPIESIKNLMQRLESMNYRFVRGGLDITAARDV